MSALRDNYGRIVDQDRTIQLPIYRPLTLDGTFTGDRDMAVNGSVTPVEFYVQPEPNRDFHIKTFIAAVTDSGNAAFTDYGSVSGPLPNGISFFIVTDGQEIPLTLNIKRNIDWAEFANISNVTSYSGNVNLTTHKANLWENSDGLYLDGKAGDRFGIRINDDVSTLAAHEMFVAGYFKTVTA